MAMRLHFRPLRIHQNEAIRGTFPDWELESLLAQDGNVRKRSPDPLLPSLI
jgi:hypothetical protein